MVGALTSWTIIGWMQEAMPGTPGWLILLISLLIAFVVCGALNYTIEKVAYRPLRNSPKLAPLITAIGMSLLLQTLAMIIWKPNYKPYPTLLPAEPFQLGGAVITVTQLFILGTTAVSLSVLMWLVHYTKLGRAMRATSENPRVAALMGVRPDTGRRDVCIQLRHRAAHHGLFARPQSLYRRRFWRHWQSWRCGAGRDFAGTHRSDWRRLHRPADWRSAGQPVFRYFCLYRADFCAHAPAFRLAG